MSLPLSYDVHNSKYRPVFSLTQRWNEEVSIHKPCVDNNDDVKHLKT